MGTKLKDKDSVLKIIGEMSLEDKMRVLTGQSMFTSPQMEEWGIPSVYYLDGGTGANYMQMFLDAFYRVFGTEGDAADELFGSTSGKAEKMSKLLMLAQNREMAEKEDGQTKKELEAMLREMEKYIPGGELPGCFPPGILLGATWDKENVYETGKALAKEADYYGIDVLLGTPNVNIHRDPLGGRLFEGYSEDPCLVSKLAPEFVKGVQSEGIIANVKHFAANNQETDRRTVNEHIPERALREIYFPGFKACVREGGCKTVMSAYNAINGKYCAMNPWLLTKVLREEWGFEGFVVSDWSAAYDQVEALEAGNDMDMPGPRSIDRVLEAVRCGRLDEQVIDRALERVLSMILEMPVMRGRRYTSIDREGSRKAAYESAREGIVLLKNENGTLPLSKQSKVSFYGEKSKKLLESGGGSANVITGQSTNPYDCTVMLIGKENVAFGEMGEDTDTVIITAGVQGQEGFDRSKMDLSAADRKMLLDTVKEAKEKQKKTVVILNICGPVDVSDYIDDIDALLCVFIPGMEGGRAAADILFGEVNPSGKLPLTFPKRYRDCPSCGNFPGRDREVWYGEGLFVGYRYYDYRDIEPRFPFGFGLSYTDFEITGLKLSDRKLDIEKDGYIEAEVTVKNTGEREGKEVVQLYIGQENPALVKPPKELKDFCKVCIRPGEEKKVTFRITVNMLESYDPGMGRWVAEPARYRVMAGTSSRHIAFTEEFEAFGYNPYGFNEKTPLGVLAATPGALDTLFAFCPAGAITREAIELSILFQSTGELGRYWKDAIEPLLDMTEDKKKERYLSMLEAVNKVTIQSAE